MCRDWRALDENFATRSRPLVTLIPGLDLKRVFIQIGEAVQSNHRYRELIVFRPPGICMRAFRTRHSLCLSATPYGLVSEGRSSTSTGLRAPHQPLGVQGRRVATPGCAVGRINAAGLRKTLTTDDKHFDCCFRDRLLITWFFLSLCCDTPLVCAPLLLIVKRMRPRHIFSRRNSLSRTLPASEKTDHVSVPQAHRQSNSQSLPLQEYSRSCQRRADREGTFLCLSTPRKTAFNSSPPCVIYPQRCWEWNIAPRVSRPFLLSSSTGRPFLTAVRKPVVRPGRPSPGRLPPAAVSKARDRSNSGRLRLIQV